MKPYLVNENELTSLSFINALMAGAASFGSILATLGIGILIDVSVDSGITGDTKDLMQIFGWTLLGLSLIPFLVVWLARKNRNSQIETIRDESRWVNPD